MTATYDSKAFVLFQFTSCLYQGSEKFGLSTLVKRLFSSFQNQKGFLKVTPQQVSAQISRVMPVTYTCNALADTSQGPPATTTDPAGMSSMYLKLGNW